MTENFDNEVLLRVEDLCQYFKLGPGRELKAVDHVSFDIKKGEVFGLVGESGCGKTTTGRSIIRLYDITGGSVYFKGERIAAGIRSYRDTIKAAKKATAERLSKLSQQLTEYPEKADEINAEIARVQAELKAEVAKQKAEIASAKFDHKNCDKVHRKRLLKALSEEYAPRIAELQEKVAGGDESAVAQLKDIKKEYAQKRRLAKGERLTTQIQMIFQDPISSLDPRMTVSEIVAEGLRIKGVRDNKYIKEQVYKALEQVSLVREHAERYPHEFSGGQRQRIGIARSVIMQPELIIADEPISALDVSIQAQVINLLNELREKLNLTILFIAHDLSVVKYFSDRIGVMYFGKMVELATSDELFAHPLHPYTKSLLSAIPLPDPHYEKQRKRVVYNPLADHDYSQQQPTLREVEKGHFVLCNDEEYERYLREVAK